MKVLKLLPLLLILTLTYCKKDENLTTEDIVPFIKNCLENSLTDSLAIAQHLVNEWKLITTGCIEGCIIDNTPVDATVSFTETEGQLIIKKAEVETTNLTFQWTLEFFNTGTNGMGFRLITNPSHYYLGMDIFCEQYMFFTDSHDESGALIIFEKL